MAKRTTKSRPQDKEELQLRGAPALAPLQDSEERVVLSENNEEVRELPEWIPVLALRDVVIYPYMIFPVLVGRESSLGSVSAAVGREGYLVLVAQKDAQEDEPKPDALYQFGTLAKVVRTIRLPNGLMKVLVDAPDQPMPLE